MATKLNLEAGLVQFSTLLYALGKEAEQVFNTFVFAQGEADDDDDYETAGKIKHLLYTESECYPRKGSVFPQNTEARRIGGGIYSQPL